MPILQEEKNRLKKPLDFDAYFDARIAESGGKLAEIEQPEVLEPAPKKPVSDFDSYFDARIKESEQETDTKESNWNFWRDFGKPVAEDVAGFGEAAYSMATGIPSYLLGVGGQAVAGDIELKKRLFKGWQTGFRGMDAGDMRDMILGSFGSQAPVKEKIASFGYQPKTEMGQSLTGIATAPVEGFMFLSDKVADKFTDDPEAKEGFRFLSDVALIVGGHQAVKFMKGTATMAKVGKKAMALHFEDMFKRYEIPDTLRNRVKLTIDALKGEHTQVSGATLGRKKLIGKEKPTANLKAQLEFDEPQRPIMERIPGSKGPVEIAGSKQGGTAPVYTHELAGLENIKDLRFNPLRELIDLETPLRVFEKYKVLKETLFDTYGESLTKMVDFNASLHDTVGNWKAKLVETGHNVNKSSEKIAGYLTERQEGGDAILRSMGKKMSPKHRGFYPDLTDVEFAIVKEAREIYDLYYKRVNEARIMNGQSPMKYEQNYYTFMRNAGALEELGMSFLDTPAETIHAKAGGPGFRYAIKRKRAPGGIEIPIDLEFFNVFEKYGRDANRAISLGPTVAKGRTFLEPQRLPTGEIGKRGKPLTRTWDMNRTTPNLANYTKEWLDYISGVKGDPKRGTRALNRLATKLNKNIGMSILSGNVRSALIQPTAIRGAYVHLGEAGMINALYKFLFDPKSREFVRENLSAIKARNIDPHIDRIINAQLHAKTRGIRGKISTAQAKVADVGIKPLQALDQWTAEVTGIGFYEQGLKMGMDKKQAIRYANDGIIRTQASGAPGHISPVQRTPMGKLATLFQTFTINEWGWLKSDVAGIGAATKIGAKARGARVMRTVFATAVMNAISEKVIGIRSPFPAVEWALKDAIDEGKTGEDLIWAVVKEGAEQLPIIGGSIRWSTPYRAAAPIAGQTLLQTPANVIGKVTGGRADTINLYDIESIMRIFGVPGLSQIMKTARRRKKGVGWPGSLIGTRTDLDKKGEVMW